MSESLAAPTTKEKAASAVARGKAAAMKAGSKARSFVTGDAHYFNSDLDSAEIIAQLDKESAGEKREAMKKVIAQICRGSDIRGLFPHVVKNIHYSGIEIRKMVYFFIVHYAEDMPNETLLCISALQKDIVHTSMFVRALSLRTLSALRLPILSPVVMVAVKKCSTDMTTIVRKASVMAVSKQADVTKTDTEEFHELLETFLGDRCPAVSGTAAAAFENVCPTRYSLLHKYYRKICRNLVEMDEWSQVAMLQILTRYARSQFVDPQTASSGQNFGAKDINDSDDDDDDTAQVARLEKALKSGGISNAAEIDDDHRLLLSCAKYLLRSLSPSVVLAVSSLYFHAAPPGEYDLCVKPLLRVLSCSTKGQSFVILRNILTMVTVRPEPFRQFYKDFFILGTDSTAVREIKVRVLAKLACSTTVTGVLAEFRSNLRSVELRNVLSVIRGLALVVDTYAASSTDVMKLLLPLLKHDNPLVVGEVVIVIRKLLLHIGDGVNSVKIIIRLMSKVFKNQITLPEARAAVVWLAGENVHSPTVAHAAPDLLRVLARGFATEPVPVKRQIITFGMKIILRASLKESMMKRVEAIYDYVLDIAWYDADYEVRDRCRMAKVALSSRPGISKGTPVSSPVNAEDDGMSDRQESFAASFALASDDERSELRRLFLESCAEAKPVASVSDAQDEGKEPYFIGSQSHLLRMNVSSLHTPEQWPTEMPSPRAREDDVGESSVSGSDSDSDSSDSGSSEDFWGTLDKRSSDESTATSDSSDSETSTESRSSSSSFSSNSDGSHTSQSGTGSEEGEGSEADEGGYENVTEGTKSHHQEEAARDEKEEENDENDDEKSKSGQPSGDECEEGGVQEL